MKKLFLNVDILENSKYSKSFQTDDCQQSRVLQISWLRNGCMIKTSDGFCDDESCKCDCHAGSSFRRGNKKRQYC